MDTPCPRCKRPLVFFPTGLPPFVPLASVFGRALAFYQCPRCGRIPRGELPERIRTELTTESVIWGVGGVVLLVLVLRLAL